MEAIQFPHVIFSTHPLFSRRTSRASMKFWIGNQMSCGMKLKKLINCCISSLIPKVHPYIPLQTLTPINLKFQFNLRSMIANMNTLEIVLILTCDLKSEVAKLIQIWMFYPFKCIPRVPYLLLHLCSFILVERKLQTSHSAGCVAEKHDFLCIIYTVRYLYSTVV